MKKTESPQTQNPALIAREVFRLLGQRRTSPTPEAYRALYFEVAGIPDPEKSTGDENQPTEKPTPELDQAALSMLSSFARKMAGAPGDAADIGYRFQRAVKTQDWDEYAKALNVLFDKYVRPAATPTKSISLVEMPTESEQLHFLRDLLVRTLTFTVVSPAAGCPRLGDRNGRTGQHPQNGTIAGRLRKSRFASEGAFHTRSR